MVTIKQIAQEVGISSSTVSIVLGGKAAERKISTATQEKITVPGPLRPLRQRRFFPALRFQK